MYVIDTAVVLHGWAMRLRRVAAASTLHTSASVDFMQPFDLERISRKAGTAVIVCPLGYIDAHAFACFLSLCRGLPERVLLVRPHVEPVPHVTAEEALVLTPLAPGLLVVDLRYGFKDDTDVPRALGRIHGLTLDPAASRYYVIDDRIVPRGALRGWPRWRRWLFAVLSAACEPAAESFCLPPECTTEISTTAAGIGPGTAGASWAQLQ
jgi:KUP system potassium uptake protein